MSACPPELEELARRIVAFHTADRRAASHLAEGVEAAFRRLHEVATRLIGPAGFAAVMERAVHQARGRCAWLETVEVVVDTTVVIASLPTIVDREGPEQVREGAAVLFAAVLALLRTLIGDGLTLSLLARSWRELGAPAEEAP